MEDQKEDEETPEWAEYPLKVDAPFGKKYKTRWFHDFDRGYEGEILMLRRSVPVRYVWNLYEIENGRSIERGTSVDLEGAKYEVSFALYHLGKELILKSGFEP